MKRFLLIMLVLAFAGSAWALGIYTAGNTTGYAVLPARSGNPVITAVNFTGGAATVDLIIYQGDNTKALSSAGKAATATTFVLDSCTGIDDDDIVVIQQRATGTPLEAAAVSSCNDTTELITLSAGTANAFNGTRGFEFFEMKVLTTWADVSTDRINVEGNLFGGTRDYPIAVKLNGTGGTVHYLSGEWR